ncbi:MAG: phosphoribosylglycinamide formyltransferase [Candidatus Eisenbacteria bacterium]|nr:phosphoribosylglycinamide formyltransferase [Candidatus Eisenbacteria bacterium]
MRSPCDCRTAPRTLSCGVLRHRPARLAVFASGNGSNFEALAAAAATGSLGGSLEVVLCDQPGAGVLARAARLGIESLTPPTGRFRSKLEDESPWLAALRERRIDVVVLAGFMRRLHATLLTPFAGRMVNIHPSLLPAFPGLDAIGQAYRHGVRVTGCTVHLVEDAIDAGPIVAQAAVAVHEHDTLESLTARVHEAEHALFAPALRRYLTEPWHIDGRRLVFGAGEGLVLPEPEAAHG